MNTAPGPRQDEPIDLFRHLPAIYQARREFVDPFSLLVTSLAEGHRDIELRLGEVPAKLDPRTAPAGFDLRAVVPAGEERAGFLEYLAGWVAIDPATVGGRDPDGTAADVGPLTLDHRTRVLRHLVEYAAPLQAARGTPRGLRYLLEVLFDADVEVLEWCWPAAFQPGATASLGVDTLLLGEPPIDRCVTLIWDSAWLREALDMPTASGSSVIELETGGGRVGTVIMSSAAATGHDRLHAVVFERLQRLDAVLKRELPAHVLGYVGFRPRAGPGATELLPFIVGVSSTLGQVQIQRRP